MFDRTTQLVALVLLSTLAACGDSTGPGDSEAQLDLGMRSGLSGWLTGPSNDMLQISASPFEGTNGTLELDEVWLIISEFELKRAGSVVDCDDDGDCESFEAPPTLVQLPLDSTVVPQLSVAIPEGQYDQLELNVEDLEFDEEGEDESAIAAVLAEARAAHPDWPSGASMLLAGSFTPSGGDPVSFRTFVEAEIEVQLDLVPPLDAAGVVSMNVVIVPSAWVERSNGTVFDLSAWDYGTTGELLQLEIEVEESFAAVEIEGS